KMFPTITGDGRHTIEELVWQDERARFVADKYLDRLGKRRAKVLALGEIVKLVEAGNHAQGCIFRDGVHLWSEELERRIDAISQRLDGFFLGRYDIRRSEEHTSELQSPYDLVCRLLLEKKKRLHTSMIRGCARSL